MTENAIRIVCGLGGFGLGLLVIVAVAGSADPTSRERQEANRYFTSGWTGGYGECAAAVRVTRA